MVTSVVCEIMAEGVPADERSVLVGPERYGITAEVVGDYVDKGAFGSVFVVTDKNNNTKVALKIEEPRNGGSFIQLEYIRMTNMHRRSLGLAFGLPIVSDFFQIPRPDKPVLHVMAMELFEHNLDKFFSTVTIQVLLENNTSDSITIDRQAPSHS